MKAPPRYLMLAAGLGLIAATACAGTAPAARTSPPQVKCPAPRGPTTAAPRIPAQDISAAGLSDPRLATPLGITGQYAGHTVNLLGGYTDAVRIVVMLRVTPNDVSLPNTLLNDTAGDINASGGEFLIGNGDFIADLDAGPPPGSDCIANLRVTVQWDLPTGNPAAPVLPLKLDFKLPVFPATKLAAGAPFKLGSWTITVKKLEFTPGTVHVAALFGGITGDEVMPSGSRPPDWLTLLDGSGQSVRTVAGGGSMATGGYVFDYEWMRPAVGGAYRVRFQGNNQTHDVSLNLPAATAA
jgi:hypothetical protein